MIPRCAGGKREEFKYSQSRKSVVRIVHRTDNRKVATRIRIKMDPNGGNAQSVFEYIFLRKSRPPAQFQGSPVVRGVDLFCGCGGLSLGAMEACRAVGKGFLPIAAVDNNPIILEL